MSEHDSVTEHISFEETKEFLSELPVDEVADQFSSRIITLVIASLGLTTALAWDETLREIFHAIFGEGETLLDKLFYSVSITLMAVIITLIFTRGLKKRKK